MLDGSVTNPGRFELPANRVRLFVYTDIPEAMNLSVSTQSRRTGKILFSRDLVPAALPAEK